jgi:hypothetical protein
VLDRIAAALLCARFAASALVLVNYRVCFTKAQPSSTMAERWSALQRSPVKLIVQIPVLDEADSIAGVLADIPRDIPGIASVEVLIIDDGCTDNTVAVALAHGADHVVRHTSRKGLATAFQTGIDTALRLGADIIVNTDGDHQYPGGEIPRLIAPILTGHRRSRRRFRRSAAAWCAGPPTPRSPTRSAASGRFHAKRRCARS